jgi:hypothetical protein
MLSTISVPYYVASDERILSMCESLQKSGYRVVSWHTSGWKTTLVLEAQGADIDAVVNTVSILIKEKDANVALIDVYCTSTKWSGVASTEAITASAELAFVDGKLPLLWMHKA